MSTLVDGATPNEAAAAAAPLRARIARWVGAFAVLALGGALAPALTERWPVMRELAAARGSGLVACGALMAALAVTPFAAFARAGSVGRGGAAPIRRALGMAAGWLALVHACTAFVGPLRADPGALTQTAHLGAGLAALCVLTLLLATSFAAVVRRARLRLWKELHRLSYVAALLVLQHVALSPGAGRTLVLGLCAALAVVLGARIAAALTARWRR